MEASFQEHFDRLSDEFYALEKSDSMWDSFDRYFQDRAQEFVHSRVSAERATDESGPETSALPRAGD